MWSIPDLSDVLGGIAACLLGIPVLSTQHSIVPRVSLRESPRASMRNALRSFANRRCTNLVVAVSEASRRSYLTLSGDRADRVVIVHNGVSSAPQPGTGPSFRAELGLDDRHLVMAMVGGLRSVKAHDVALAAVAELRDLPSYGS